jgi:hypothetical protein
MLSAIRISVIMLTAITLSVIILIVIRMGPGVIMMSHY